jgi:uncharacterized protein (TIGR04255 family)
MWTLPTAQHRIYPRNQLALVVCQLKFQPILRIGDQISAFQERVRVGTEFRGYQAVDVELVDVTVGGSVHVRRETQHQFTAADATLALAPTTMTLDFRKHQSRDRIFTDVAAALSALREVYDPVHPVRLGLRYVNQIDRLKIGSDLGREVTWNELIHPEFFSAPVRLVDMEGTLFYSEVTSPLRRGSLTLRFGLTPHQSSKIFMLDLDRAVGEPIRLDEIHDLLAEFANDIFAVFDSACGPGLRVWLEG